MIEAILLLVLASVIPLLAGHPVAWGVSGFLSFLIFAQFVRIVLRMAPPFVPTARRDVRKMTDAARIRKGDRAYDLGCGDGRLVRAAAEKGAVVTGYELSVPTWLLAKALTSGTPGADIRYGDFWKKDVADADVIFCFLLDKPMRRFRDEVWPRLGPGCRVVSYMFAMPDVPPAKRDGHVILYVK